MVKVLLIEDDMVFRKMLNDMLLSRFPGLSIELAGSCASAVKSIESQPPDLIFMDIKLPDGNGLILTQEIKKDHPKIIIVVLSLSDNFEYRLAARELGADYFISKDTLGEEGSDKLIDFVFSILRSEKSQSEICSQ